jgi:hypothetical protein
MPYCTLILTFNFTSWGLPVLSRSNTIAFAVTTKFNCSSLFVSGISWRSVAKQSSREFATTVSTTRIQDAGFQVSGVSTKSSLNLRSHLHTFNVQRNQNSARTHREFRAPAMNMWREGSRGHLKYSRRRLLVFFFQRCDNASSSNSPAMQKPCCVVRADAGRSAAAPVHPCSEKSVSARL